MDDLFASQRPAQIAVTDGIRQLTGFADTASLQSGLDEVLSISPWRQQQTPGGRTIRVRITNCGDYGWVSDARGYRYEATDPVTGAPWPALPEAWVQLAVRAASTAGCPDYRPNACLINRYEVGDSMGSHQDKNERDFRQPVVTVSLGLPAEFLIYGDTRGGTPAVASVYDGDVIVMGGTERLAYHGVRKIRPGNYPVRISLTFRYVAPA